MRFPKLSRTAALVAFAAAFTACSDSTGPTELDASSALQSLSIGLNQVGGIDAPDQDQANAAFSAILPLLDIVNVSLDGSSQSFYALALRESYPEGTCEEALFADPTFPTEPGVCTPLSLGVVTILWQSRSASRAPDKLILIVGDAGTSTFDFLAQDFPAVAIYVQGQDRVFGSESGTMTTQVTATNETCDIPLPPYAKAGTCNFATFTEQGSIVMSEFALEGPTGRTTTIGIPSITLDGLWLNITEVQPIMVASVSSAARVVGRMARGAITSRVLAR